MAPQMTTEQWQEAAQICQMPQTTQYALQDGSQIYLNGGI